jgi:hypothetical protein
MTAWLALAIGGWTQVPVGLAPQDDPASVPLQLCPVIEEAFKDMYADFLKMAKGRYTTPHPPTFLWLSNGSPDPAAQAQQQVNPFLGPAGIFHKEL